MAVKELKREKKFYFFSCLSKEKLFYQKIGFLSSLITMGGKKVAWVVFSSSKWQSYAKFFRSEICVTFLIFLFPCFLCVQKRLETLNRKKRRRRTSVTTTRPLRGKKTRAGTNLKWTATHFFSVIVKLIFKPVPILSVNSKEQSQKFKAAQRTEKTYNNTDRQSRQTADGQTDRQADRQER